MSDVFRGFELVRRIAEAIADGRVEAAQVSTMTDEQLAEFDTEVYQRYLEVQKEREALLNDVEPTPKEKKDETD